MSVVLGIDAAWTANNPSGVALVCRSEGRWTLSRVASSYAAFISGIDEPKPTGGTAPVANLLQTAKHLAGTAVDVVAVDMPLAHGPIIGRRAADDAVSRRFGAMKCSTHSPSRERPGLIALKLRDDFVERGYPLRVAEPLTPQALVEVYPHPALVRLCGTRERLPYKYQKRRKYWADHNPPAAELTSRILATWRLIVEALETEIVGTRAALDPGTLRDASSRQLKAFEDQLDAVVCAWVGVCILENRAESYGEEQLDARDSAIWIPTVQMAKLRDSEVSNAPDRQNTTVSNVTSSSEACMTALLDRAVGALRRLPLEDQNQLARALLALALDGEELEAIPVEDLAAVEEGLAQARRGEFVSAERVATAFSRFDG